MYMYIYIYDICILSAFNFSISQPHIRDRPRHRRGLFLNGAPRQRAADVSLHQRHRIGFLLGGP